MNPLIRNFAAYEIKSVIRFLNANKIEPSEILRQICKTYGNNAMPDSMVREWIRKFEEGCDQVDDEQNGSPFVISDELESADQEIKETQKLSPSLVDVDLRNMKSLVISGDDANVETFPFQVSIQINGRHIGGAVIIDKSYVLTAAHCLNRKRNIENFQLVAGIDRLNEVSKCKQTRSFEESNIRIHPKFQSERPIFNDIALIKLSEPWIFNDHVGNAKLPKVQAYPEGSGTISGFGYTSKEAAGASNKLQSLKLPLLSLRDVRARLRVEGMLDCFEKERRAEERLLGRVDEEREAHRGAAAELAEGRARSLLYTDFPRGMPWTGDSGSPLTQNGVVIGIVSGGDLKTNFAAYTSVASFVRWIEETMWQLQNNS